jgi:holliday junction DNA helicase RuvB
LTYTDETEIMSDMNQTTTTQKYTDQLLSVFDVMMGQKHVIATVMTAVKAYHNDRMNGLNISPENTIAVGPAGTGKSTICKLAHKAFGFPAEKFYETLGTTLTQDILISTLLSLDSESTLYIDEAMGLSADLKQILLKALEDNLLLIPDQKKTRIHKIPLEKFHCCLALTDEHKLEPALRQRFGTYLRFQLYSEYEIIEILKNKSTELKMTVDNDGAILPFLANRARKTPRIAIQLLKAAWRVARSENSNILKLEHAHKAMEIAQIYPLGCSIDEVNYLRILNENYNVPTRLNTIGAKMGLPKQTLTDVIEPYLVQVDLIEKLPAGRILTEAGLNYINKMTLN